MNPNVPKRLRHPVRCHKCGRLINRLPCGGCEIEAARERLQQEKKARGVEKLVDEWIEVIEKSRGGKR